MNEKNRNRIIALDIGTVRIGVAVSDPTGTFAQPVCVIRAGPGWMNEFSVIADEYDASAILVGMPVRTDGTDGPEARGMRMVITGIYERFPDLEIISWDERFTTTIATQALIEADVSRASRKRRVDKVAAVVLLQSYLDSMKGQAVGSSCPYAARKRISREHGGRSGYPGDRTGRGR